MIYLGFILDGWWEFSAHFEQLTPKLCGLSWACQTCMAWECGGHICIPGSGLLRSAGLGSGGIGELRIFLSPVQRWLVLKIARIYRTAQRPSQKFLPRTWWHTDGRKLPLIRSRPHKKGTSALCYRSQKEDGGLLDHRALAQAPGEWSKNFCPCCLIIVKQQGPQSRMVDLKSAYSRL